MSLFEGIPPSKGLEAAKFYATPLVSLYYILFISVIIYVSETVLHFYN